VPSPSSWLPRPLGTCLAPSGSPTCSTSRAASFPSATPLGSPSATGSELPLVEAVEADGPSSTAADLARGGARLLPDHGERCQLAPRAPRPARRAINSLGSRTVAPSLGSSRPSRSRSIGSGSTTAGPSRCCSMRYATSHARPPSSSPPRPASASLASPVHVATVDGSGERHVESRNAGYRPTLAISRG